MRFANIILLFITFTASVMLLVVMWQRRLIERVPLFFALILLYILRSTVLLAGMRLFDHATYLQISSFMSLFDLALQLALAYTLIRRFTQSRSNSLHRLRNSAVLLFAVGLLLASGSTLLLVSAFPGYSPVPLDRGVIFSGFVFLFLLVVAKRGERTAEGRLLFGFCIVSLANILAQCGKTLAATQNDARLFLVCAYANTVVWVAVLVFWILRLEDSSAGREVTDGTAVMAN